MGCCYVHRAVAATISAALCSGRSAPFGWLALHFTGTGTPPARMPLLVVWHVSQREKPRVSSAQGSITDPLEQALQGGATQHGVERIVSVERLDSGLCSKIYVIAADTSDWPIS